MNMNGPSNSRHAQRGANRALVAGIGNIFMGDDGFGCEVAQRLARCDLLDDVDVVDFGIRGMDLGYALMDGYAQAILVDTVERGGAPGSVYVIELEIDEPPVDSTEELITPHGMDPTKVLRFIASLGDRRPRTLLVACEPEYLGGEDGHMGLSEPVAAAVGVAIDEIRQVLAVAAQAGGRPSTHGVAHTGANAPGELT